MEVNGGFWIQLVVKPLSHSALGILHVQVVHVVVVWLLILMIMEFIIGMIGQNLIVHALYRCVNGEKYEK
jgi:hypothetical protein